MAPQYHFISLASHLHTEEEIMQTESHLSVTTNFLLLDLANDESGVGYSEFLFQFSFAATSGKMKTL